ncbi:helix-turn-helix transcriptional regulator [Anaerostipes sp.]|jgi:transcriptional regulator with XRE-family HTH domain|uniref:helix-turn-helix transcriptional regulator n=1 Tax=Anaerostipes sp. TaxID=1872530 RepID=UPI0020519040|nr:helix-turn-helix transcriptional regulator [Anaerostipes sp.]MBS5414101.1 helix-turn-helix transcriptional regulator [Bacillota bacterium]MED9813991.1 helix-turn-helix transcriptional regulator [Anaerostipes sp.]DAJ63603.1 MAG TPA: Helix-turn-helix XRE-family like protein [Caudoviricetes sp.]
MLDAKEIGCRLRELRGNIPRETVADAVGISVSAISMYENGERIPRDVVKVKLASYYGRSVQEIFFDEKCHV